MTHQPFDCAGGTASVCAGSEQAVADARAGAATAGVERQAFTRNSFKCSACMRVHHAEGSPLVLCDFCPRSFHLRCLEVPDGGLPLGEWACPKCLERQATARAKAVGGRSRRTTSAPRSADVCFRPSLCTCGVQARTRVLHEASAAQTRHACNVDAEYLRGLSVIMLTLDAT